MNNQNLIFYQFNPLYKTLKELEQDLIFKIIESLNEKSLNIQIKNLNNYLIITKKKISKLEYQYIFDHLPIKIFKFIEKLNIEFLKKQFSDQSEIIINDYKINLNSREMLFNNTKLKLTEKEVNTIIYLFKIKKAASIDELQTKVWGYRSNIETHTVETHIYRLRKKISKIFNDDNFIISKKNGYQIK
jgi:Response regulators consisting of a CheY-like receiver domain and a winged-helix DNA-binding domain